MKILVTGATGFIGSAIVPLLQREGHEISVLDNLSFGNRSLIDVPESHFYVTDLRDQKGVATCVKEMKPDVVVHLAAIHFIPYCNAHPYESADINIRGTVHLLDAIRSVGTATKVIFASTAAVYPIYNEAVTEQHPVGPLDIYGLSKLTGERLCKEFYLESGIDTIVCRFFNAFGPNETNPHVIPEIEGQLRRGGRTIKLGNLEPKRDFIHTYDMANAIKALLRLENAAYDVFNLGRGIEYSIVEVVEAFGRILNEKIEIEIDPEKVRKTDRLHLLADVSKLKSRTGWAPEWDLDKGIHDLVANW
jgi:UDP-glucose 4-epimerase